MRAWRKFTRVSVPICMRAPPSVAVCRNACVRQKIHTRSQCDALLAIDIEFAATSQSRKCSEPNMVFLTRHSGKQSSRTLCSQQPWASITLSRTLSVQRPRRPSFNMARAGISTASFTNNVTSRKAYIASCRPDVRSCCTNSTDSGSSSHESASPSQIQQPGMFEARAAALCGRITSLFPFWVVIAAGVALTSPPVFLPIAPHLTTGLALTMLGMGLTMRLSDFGSVVATMPQLLVLGMVMQFTIMPALGFVFSRYAGLDPPLAIGMALLSACPGGTASNVVAYIARGEMGLSILMTTCSTLAAVVATPAIIVALAGHLVPINGGALLTSTAQVVLAPVLCGVALNQFFPVTVARVAQFTPCVATLLVAAVVGATLAASAGAVVGMGGRVLAAVVALHSSGFALGYFVSKGLGLSEKICRTNSIEVGMQNSTLGAVLATLHFSDPLVAAPCAISACAHAILGSILAGLWRASDDARDAANTRSSATNEPEDTGGAEPSPA